MNLRRSFTVAAISAAIVAVPGIASAHGVNDPTTTPYCGPGQTWAADQGKCINTHPHDISSGPDAGEWGVAGLALLSLLCLL